MKPFLKWAGGKRWIANRLVGAFPTRVNRYVEPFLGSGAVYFAYEPKAALLSDINAELVGTYLTLRNAPRDVYNRLAKYHTAHSSDLYYHIRDTKPTNDIDAATRFIYLNRTCWNGLYRVNQRNEFNVPKGTKSTVVFPDDDFESISNMLGSAHILACDFEEVIDQARVDDLIYVDPPYTVKHNSNGFVKYNQKLFSWQDQIRLAASLVRAKSRGCHIFISNADHESVRELYRRSFPQQQSTPRSSVLAGRGGVRGPTTEFLVVHHG